MRHSYLRVIRSSAIKGSGNATASGAIGNLIFSINSVAMDQNGRRGKMPPGWLATKSIAPRPRLKVFRVGAFLRMGVP